MKNVLRKFFYFVLFIGSAAVLTLLSLLLAFGVYDYELFFDYFRQPAILILNFIPVLLLQCLLYALFGRQWISYFFTGLLVLGMSAGDYFMLKLRYKPFQFSEMSMVKAGLTIASEYEITPDARILLAVAGLVLGTIVLAIVVRDRVREPEKRRRKHKFRRFLAIFVPLAAIPLFLMVYSSEELYNGPLVTTINAAPGWEQQQYAARGFIYPFLHSISTRSDRAPKGYNSKEAAVLHDSYPDSSIPAEKKTDVIFLQLEAFNDIRRFGIEGISEDAYAYYDALKDLTLHGTLVTNVFGGGTIETEHCVLTGEHTYRYVSEDSPSFVRYFASQGYVTSGNHPNSETFYSRIARNSYLGFESYHYTEDLFAPMIEDLKPTDWYSDCVVLPEILKQYRSYKAAGKDVFLFNVTMQGHGDYVSDEYLFTDRYFDGSGCSAATDCELNNYLGSVADTQNQLKSFLEALDREVTPVVVVLYGDHKPGFDQTVVRELGISLNTGTEDGFKNYYTTEYLIWGNTAAWDRFGEVFYGEGETISACYLMPQLFRTLGWKGDSYCAYLQDGMNTLPVIKLAETGEEQEQLRQLNSAIYYRRRVFAK